MIASVNPATGERIQSYPEIATEQLEPILHAAAEACTQWRRTSFAERSQRMRKLAGLLRTHEERYATLMAVEMGKPVRQGRAEIEKCAAACEFFADNAEKFLAPEEVKTDAAKSYVTFEPFGSVLAIMPWNFPFWQVVRAAAPALMAGNVMLLKHASNVPGCALALEELFEEAGFPDDVFTSLLLDTEQIPQLIEDPLIHAVTLTGSVPAGRAVGTVAGGALKKAVLELGGSDPYLILKDANLAEAAKTCGYSRLINSGQSCISAKRFIVEESVRPEFEKLLVEYMSAQKMGDPLNEDVTIGPLARLDLRDSLHEQVEDSLGKGAKLLLGGKIPEGPGAYYPPTVLTNVKPGMPAYEEETFGPVAAVISAKDDKDAVRIANDSVFGLGASVFTSNRPRGEEIARKELEAGLCFVNTYVRSDARLPFGGVKQSGVGRELGTFGIREFVNIKTVFIA